MSRTHSAGRMTTTLATVSLALLAAACAGPSGQALPSAASIPITSVSPAGSSSPATVSTPAAPAMNGEVRAPASSSAESGVRLTLVPGENEARFRAREQLAGRSLPNDAVGSTRNVSGTIVFGPNGAILSEQSKVLVDLRTLKSDQGRRDNFIKNNTLQTSQFPTAEFVPREARELASPLPATGEGTFQLIGNLTVHGATRPATWDVSTRFAGQEVAGSAVTTVRLEDFGMSRPTVGPVLSIEETLRLELDFRAAQG
jgi:polyisoprenoid-binding protein YceI